MIEVFGNGFERKEFACKCGCGFSTVDAELLAVLRALRKHFNTSVTITSGCRCVSHNRKVGGEEGSQHTFGKAADIQVKGVHPRTVYRYLTCEYPDRYGIGLYSSWVHIDVRDNKARWDKTYASS